LDLVDVQPTIQEMAATAEVVADRAASAGDRRGEAVAQVAAAQYQVALAVAGAIDGLEARARALLPLLTESNDHAALVRVWVALGRTAARRGRFEEATQAIEQAISHARQIGQPGLFGLSFALIVDPRPADEGLRTLDLLLGDEPHPFPRMDRAVLLAMLGRFEEARIAAHEGSARLRELTGRSEAGEGPLADIETLAGDYERAVHHWRILRDWTEERGHQGVLCQAVLWLGRSLCMLGQHDEAGKMAQRGRELGAEQDVLTQTLWRRVDALVLASRGEYQEAEKLAREAVAIIERTDGLRWQGDALCDLAEVLRRAGRSQDAATSLQQALDRYERKRNLAMAAQVRQRMGAGKGSASLA
jgi:tetratricopeptide (TPR) repeat protein